MRKLTLFLVGWLVPVAVFGQTAIAWDESVVDAGHGAPSGYTLQWGTASGLYTQALDAGMATSVSLPPGLTPKVTYFFTVVARGAGLTSVPSNEVSFTPAPPAVDTSCDYPLGNRSIKIFVTPPLLKTGTGAPGTDARLSFRVLSPNSPVTHVGVVSNGVELSGASGSNLNALGSMWFVVPATPSYAVVATNAYGCTRTQIVP